MACCTVDRGMRGWVDTSVQPRVVATSLTMACCTVDRGMRGWVDTRLVRSNTDWTVTVSGMRTVLYWSILMTLSSTDLRKGEMVASRREEVITFPSLQTSTVSHSSELARRGASSGDSILVQYSLYWILRSWSSVTSGTDVEGTVEVVVGTNGVSSVLG